MANSLMLPNRNHHHWFKEFSCFIGGKPKITYKTNISSTSITEGERNEICFPYLIAQAFIKKKKKKTSFKRKTFLFRFLFNLDAGDCHNSKGEEDMCVVGAINNYTTQLQAYGDSSNGYNLTESLMFLAHFVGDVHQPLHVSFEADEGGNTIIIHWYRRKTNLHHAWDVSIIETAMKDFYNDDLDTMIQFIQKNITHEWSDEVSQWETCRGKSVTCADKYAAESIQLACDYAYKDVDQDSTLGDDYFFSRLPVVEKRIAQGGMRLATILNQIFDGNADGNHFYY